MMDKRFNPEKEKEISKFWQKEKIYAFDSNSKKRPYIIDTPPPYVSGNLHAGHFMHYTQFDFIARYRRMKGFNVMYPWGWDCNGMPIEVQAEKLNNIKMSDLPRGEFAKICADLVKEMIKKMKAQVDLWGHSIDWNSLYRTCSEEYRRLTQISFLRLYKDGRIYRGEFPVNFCSRCETAIADAEVEYSERETRLNYIIFPLKEGGNITVATTRPELLGSCSLIAVHPDDMKNKGLIGKTAVTPIFGKEIKIKADRDVDPEFGTGLVMICTFGDKEDIKWAYKHRLPFIMSIDSKGRMTDKTGKYKGMFVKEARKAILEDIKAENLFVKDEPLKQRVGKCWRCSMPIEFIATKQWFLKVTDKKKEILKKAEEINWHPEFFKQRIIDWTKNLDWDWCISRQRVFATPIPLWECSKCGKIILAKEDECYVRPMKEKRKCGCGGEAVGTSEVFDTWMDSSISNLYVSGWLRDEKTFKKSFPVALRPQAHDIIRTWAFYTIIKSLLHFDKKSWNDIMISGHGLDEKGHKMSKSKGNTVVPDDMIAKYSADAMRLWAGMSSLGSDIPFREKDIDHGQKFLIKVWNASRFASQDLGIKPKKRELNDIDRWILSRMNAMLKEAEASFENFESSKALSAVHDFFWNDFCGNYLEMVKHRLYSKEEKRREGCIYALYTVLLNSLKVMAPFAPFMSEEIYQSVFRKHEKGVSIHISEWPEAGPADPEAEEAGELAKEIISQARRWKTDNSRPMNFEIEKVAIKLPEEKMPVLEKVLEDIKMTVKIKEVEVKKGKKLEAEIFQA